MVVHGRVELLAHPLSQKYLQMKWNSYGKYFHLAHLVLYVIYLTFVTTFSSKLMDYSENKVIRNTTVNFVHIAVSSYKFCSLLFSFILNPCI